jgi:hypothetical protein
MRQPCQSFADRLELFELSKLVPSEINAQPLQESSAITAFSAVVETVATEIISR